MDLFLNLSPSEKKEILFLFQGLSLEENISIESLISEIKYKRNSSGYHCTSCNSSSVSRYGKYRGTQRYICKDCHKTFTDLSGSCLHYIHQKQKFLLSAALMLKGATLKETSFKLGINIATAFNWRHKVLSILNNLEDEALTGIVEADDTFFLSSNKGSKNLKRKSRKRGGCSSKRGISSEQVCVIVAKDRKDHIVSGIATLGRPSASEIDKLLGPSLGSKSILLTDRHPSFSCFAKEKGLHYIPLDISKGRRSIKGIYHIGHVNSYHSRLKDWIRRFKGIATKYLNNYLHWFEFLERHLKNKTEEAAQRALLLNACLIKAV